MLAGSKGVNTSVILGPCYQTDCHKGCLACWPVLLLLGSLFLLCCAEFISVSECLSIAFVCVFDGVQGWMSFHLLKLTSYNSFRVKWPSGWSAHVSAGDLILRSSLWVQEKCPLCEAAPNGPSQSPFHFRFFLCVEVLNLYPLVYQSYFVFSYMASNLGKLPFPLAFRLVFSSVFLLDFLWFNIFTLTNLCRVRLL